MLRRRVLNVVGHELRTPVTTLRGPADALEGAGTDTERVQLADALVRSARRLESLVDDLLVAMGVTTVSSEDDRVVVSVSSPGPDLPDADLAMATEPFYRRERAVTLVPGLGLGLAVARARALVDHAGGSLRLARRAGGGTTTIVEVPA